MGTKEGRKEQEKARREGGWLQRLALSVANEAEEKKRNPCLSPRSPLLLRSLDSQFDRYRR